MSATAGAARASNNTPQSAALPAATQLIRIDASLSELGTMHSAAEGVAPLLDHLRDALDDLVHGRAQHLDLGEGLGALKRLHLGPERLAAVAHRDLGVLDAEQELHEEPRRIGMRRVGHHG